DLGAVVEGVLLVEADADRPGAAVAVHAVAAEPGPQHLDLGLRGEQRVDAAGLLVGGVTVAPVVVRAGEGPARAQVLAAQVAHNGVGHGEGAAGSGGVEVDRLGAVPGGRAVAVQNMFLGVQHGAGGRVDVHGQPARALGVGAGDRGLPGQPRRRVEGVDDLVGVADATDGR